MMKVDASSIQRELRLVGTVFRVTIGEYSENSLRIMSAATKLIFKNRICPPGMRSSEVDIKREDGSELRLYVYRSSEDSGEAPGVLWIHGGGFVMGAPAMDLIFVRSLIKKSPCVVVSPDYALSVERPYPAAIEDCYLALCWMREHARELGIREDQLFAGGESAGGGLTAALTLLARDRGKVRLAYQMPLYPMLDDRMQTESMIGNDAPIWNEGSNEPAWRLYLGELFGSDEVPKYAAPARETDYFGLPPAYSYIGSIDPFRDETIKYFDDLRSAGVEARLDLYEGCFHGFEAFCPLAKIAEEAKTRFLDEYKYAVDNYFATQPEPAGA